MKIPLHLLFGALLALGSVAFGLSGCNTTAGMGEDIEAAGDAIEGEAEEHKGY